MIPYFRTRTYTITPIVVMTILTVLVMLLSLKIFNISILRALIIIPIPLILLYGISGSSWFICEHLEFKRASLVYTLTTHILAAFIAISIWGLLSRFYIHFMSKTLDLPEIKDMVQEGRFFFMALGFGIYFVSILTNYLIITIKKRKEAEVLAYKNNLLKTKAELKFIKSAIHPHFLFNSLNLLTPIISKDPQLAKEALGHLSEFLLYSLRFSEKDEVTIQDEIDHIKDYLSIEALRLQERLSVIHKIDDKVLNHKIPPLTLLPVVENAIKHGIEQLLEGGEISITVQTLPNNKFYIEVKNPYKSYRPPKGSNLGLYILKERLKDYFGSEARIDVDKGDELFIIRLTLSARG